VIDYLNAVFSEKLKALSEPNTFGVVVGLIVVIAVFAALDIAAYCVHH
jgi:hypothetical protein